MLEVTFLGWAATLALVAVLFVVDLVVSRPSRAHMVGFPEAVVASLCYVGVALGFGAVLGLIAGWDFGAQDFAGYIVENSLSVDNLFVFVVIATSTSLIVIGAVLALTVAASLCKSRRDPAARAHPGSLRDRAEENRTPATR